MTAKGRARQYGETRTASDDTPRHHMSEFSPNVGIGYAIEPPQQHYRDLTSKPEFPEQN